MQLAPVRATIVSTEDRLAIAKERLIGTVHRLVQADGDALHASRGAEQALLAWLRAVLDGPRAVRMACLHEPAYFAHRRRTIGQGHGVLHLDEGEGSRRGIDAPAPVDRVRFEVALDRAGGASGASTRNGFSSVSVKVFSTQRSCAGSHQNSALRREVSSKRKPSRQSSNGRTWVCSRSL